jgi:major membrane immunogen (membrane-anchored lipoprotein)
MKRLSVVLIVIIALSALLTACGGGAAASDPAGVVKSAMTAITEKNFDKLSEFVCAAQKDKVAQTFNPAGALAGAGVDAQKILDAMSIKLDNGEFTKVSESGDKAEVQMKGNLTISVDKEKFKAVMVDLAKAQGQELPADQMDQVLDMVIGQFSQGIDLDEKVAVIKEGGKWVMCPEN